MSENTALYAFEKYGDMVLRTAYVFAGNYHEAEDITQEIFLKLHSSPQDFQSEEHMKAWLIRAAVNHCKNYRKSARISKTSHIDEALENTLSCEFSEKDNEVKERIEKLPEKYSLVIYLHYFEGYSIKEIASVLGKNENTVGSLLRRGRAKLKIELEKEGYAYET